MKAKLLVVVTHGFDAGGGGDILAAAAAPPAAGAARRGGLDYGLGWVGDEGLVGDSGEIGAGFYEVADVLFLGGGGEF